MPKQSLTQKSVYWMKVISLGLILGLGIQFAEAWTNPDPIIAPPGGNVSGPITMSGVAQYKTGKLGVNSNITPINALEVGGGGNAVIGGGVYATSGQINGVLSSGKVQIVDVVVENTDCAPMGLVARDNTGILLSCQGSPLKWKKASGGSGASCPSSGQQSGRVYIFDNGGSNGPMVKQCLDGVEYNIGAFAPWSGGAGGE